MLHKWLDIEKIYSHTANRIALNLGKFVEHITDVMRKS